MHGNMCRVLPTLVRALATSLFISIASTASAQVLPPVPFPPENQFTQEKSDLGKILFWDEQLSSDNTMSCGSCHQPAAAGTDARIDINPGLDALFGTDDDIFGSPGVVTQSTDEEYIKSVIFGLLPQVTGRQAPPAVMSMYAPESFWDGRAGQSFSDPLTGELLIESGGALENQAVGPFTSDVEMAHQGRDWEQILDKLVSSRPMALASDLPTDMNTVVSSGNSYPDLFEAAFGDSEITAGRIGMAIATYERTLVPNQSPFDQFVAGNTNALTQAQIDGMNAFRASRCNTCHGGAQFTGNTFRNIGLRPIAEDSGRFEVTNALVDRGRFKTPSLRNIGLRDRFMHNGQLQTIQEVFDFYARRNGQVSFPQNRDPLLDTPIAFPPPVENDIIDFLVNALTDPRVATESVPFDRPLLYTEQPVPNPEIIESGVAGSGGFIPEMIVIDPPNIGNAGFKVGVSNALGGAQALVTISTTPPIDGLVTDGELLGPIILESIGAGEGYGTMQWPIPNDQSLDGQIWYMQWVINDPEAPTGFAYSPVAQLTTFCSMNGSCINLCPADFNIDGVLDFFDISAFLTAYAMSDPIADFSGDGNFDFFDISAFLTAYA
ncbi:MAG: hypothetical protein JJ974_12755, partial [Phycisphaerales bacterium]|nr:hypothetical protein [Phycisphaerales bacterium]